MLTHYNNLFKQLIFSEEMNFNQVNIPERYELFPQADKLADLALKKLGFLTSSEQSSIKTSVMYSAFEHVERSLESQNINDRESAEFYSLLYSQHNNINPFRDLSILQREGVSIHKTLKEVKQSYNQIVSDCINKSPHFMGLVWQVYRRTHWMYPASCDLEKIITPPKAETKVYKYNIPSPRTDEERVRQYESEMHSLSTDERWQSEPRRRLVESDPHYFYGTGRFAFAVPNGDIFQTIWDERKKEFPLFDVD